MGKHTSRDVHRRGDAPQNAAVTEFSLKGLASGARPDDVLLRIDHARRTTAVTLIYSHGSNPNGDLSLPFPTGPGQITNDTAAPTNLARLPNRSGSPCARGCPERIGSGGRTQTTVTVPIPRPDRVGEEDAGRVPPLPRRGAQAAPPVGSPAARSPERSTSQAGSPAPAASSSTRPTASGSGSGSETSAAQPPTRPVVGTPVTVKVEKGITSALPESLDAARPALARKRSTTTLRPYRHTHKIRNTTRRTTWYGPSASARALAAPPDGLRPARAWLYVHRYRGGAGTQRHPDMEGYVLHLLDNGEPRWVKEASAKTYACGKKMRQRRARYM
ncbi:hypothetical protein C8Q78DRAFT_990755 [Trametes maxima]|nr:hypothetical protein C8Q78DRAFT_990755 [Trametes maxima]